MQTGLIRSLTGSRASRRTAHGRVTWWCFGIISGFESRMGILILAECKERKAGVGRNGVHGHHLMEDAMTTYHYLTSETFTDRVEAHATANLIASMRRQIKRYPDMSLIATDTHVLIMDGPAPVVAVKIGNRYPPQQSTLRARRFGERVLYHIQLLGMDIDSGGIVDEQCLAWMENPQHAVTWACLADPMEQFEDEPDSCFADKN